ncbi:MAG: DNA modification methylase [Novosphingobium sp.]
MLAKLEVLRMGFIIKPKLKAELHRKSKSAKKHHEQEVSLAGVTSNTSTELLPAMKLERRPLSSLKGLKRRVRKSEADQIERVCRSIKNLKQSAPILINEDGEILNGHIVAEALRRLGSPEVWCAVVDHLDEHECDLLHVALNRIAETGDWDLAGLQPLLIEFEELGFDLGATGFSLPELDIIMSGNPADTKKPNEEKLIEVPDEPVSQLGDLWLMGKHRLLCGDSTSAESYALVLKGDLTDCIFTDCPWNIPIEGFVSSNKHKDFKMGVGEWNDAEFAGFCETFHKLNTDHLKDGCCFYSFIDWRSVDVIMAAGRYAGLDHIGTAVWNKGSGGMGTPYRSAHEFVVIFRKGPKLAVNNIQLGKHGRDRTNVWSYPGANQPGSSANKALEHHPTPKPIELVQDALLDVTNRGALVFDPFMGSGTTLLAAHKSGRRACGIELDPKYVDVAIRRWEEMTEEQAIHEQTGLTFRQLAKHRCAGSNSSLAA